MPVKFKNVFRSSGSRSQSSLPTPSPLALEPSSSQATAPSGPPAQPSQTIISPSSTATNIYNSPAPIGEDQNYGVKVLYDSGTEASVDIVFVHGLTGNAYNTWLHKNTRVHWPSQLLGQDIPDARILSFGYDADIVNFWNPASNSRLTNHAENMVGDLVRKRERTNTETRKILFVAHSLGGLVVECALSHSRGAVERYLHQIEQYTAGIVFLGVPHCGADLASWASFGTRMTNVLKRANTDIVGVLKPGSEMLRMVGKNFHNILRLRKEEGSEISITCFYEELPVIGIGEIVPLHSAEIKGYSCYGIHANHMDMTKFPNREDRGYDAVLGELQRWKKQAHRAPGKEPRSDREMAKQWIVPRAASRLYTGRVELGKRLAQMLLFDPSTPPIQQRIFVIVGVGGTGKSEVCLKFVEDHRDEYWGVFWLDAGSIATAEQGYGDIGRRCGVAEPSVESTKSWLAWNSQRWLLIIDNADNPDIDYSKYIPSSIRGDILLTTRNPECGTYNTVGSETLGDLEPQLARKLLLRATNITESRWKEEEEAATAVVKILGSHTLAIIQAGAFVRQNLCTLEDYPTIFQQQKGQLLKFYSKQNLSVYSNVYTTFEVSAEYLQKSNLPESLDALNLLHTLAFMHNSGISETMFQRASEYASELRDTGASNDEEVLSLSIRHVARLPGYAQQEWSSFQGRLRWRKACSTLASLSIITVGEDDKSMAISAHSLVHAWAKERQDYQSRCRAWQSAATIIALSCQGWYSYSPFFTFLQPHVRACVDHEINEYTEHMSDMEAAQIFIQFASVLNTMMDESSLNFLVQHIHLRLPYRSGADQKTALQIKVLTGRVFRQQGKLREAVDIFKEVVEGRSRVMAKDHPSRLASQHELASAYRANGQVDRAVTMLEHVVKIREKLAEDHPSRLTSQHELAIAYRANEQVDRAVTILEHIVKIKEKLAEDYPSRLASQHELAIAYRANGQVARAVTMLEHVVKIKEKLAEDHPSRLASQHELAVCYIANGKVDRAMPLLEHIVKVQKKLAEDHPSRLASQHELAICYIANGKVDTAITLLEHVVKVQEKLAEDHPSRLVSQRHLASAYREKERVDEVSEVDD